MTTFESNQVKILTGEAKEPIVNIEGKVIPFLPYQIILAISSLKLMAKGLGFRHLKLKDIKNYYGLKGRTAADCLIELEELKKRYIG